uniref:Methyltransferase FkbM domain-containing protein n=1 Tax=Clastoptera arizonana TaxID=38151 RepID=A0A1B6CJ41_9HEMI
MKCGHLKKVKTWIFLFLLCVCVITITKVSSDIRKNEMDFVKSISVLQWYNYTEGKHLNGPKILMNDPRLVTRLQQNFLIPPPEPFSKHPYHLTKPELTDTSMGQAEKVKQILKYKKNGFFVECGAMDGETRSNTLYFERYLNWTGLLIEADPLNFGEMMLKNRRAWLSPTCLSKTQYPTIVSFKQQYNQGKISDETVGSTKPDHVDVQCFPFYTYMLAMNITNVDYFSLDVEGDELDVLKTIPFHIINIETLSVEFIHVKEGRDSISEFMKSKGYRIDSEVTHPNWLANDYIFVKNR